ncbi:hypothetical protein C0993_004959 [Termitomyces sp. T159_Od127]|nr:hypothetical protein C0993_004959 [Termitomyces sp. T159_Od127]
MERMHDEAEDPLDFDGDLSDPGRSDDPDPADLVPFGRVDSAAAPSGVGGPSRSAGSGSVVLRSLNPTSVAATRSRTHTPAPPFTPFLLRRSADPALPFMPSLLRHPPDPVPAAPNHFKRWTPLLQDIQHYSVPSVPADPVYGARDITLSCVALTELLQWFGQSLAQTSSSCAFSTSIFAEIDTSASSGFTSGGGMFLLLWLLQIYFSCSQLSLEMCFLGLDLIL